MNGYAELMMKNVALEQDRQRLLKERDKLAEALASIRDFRQEENEWDGVEECMPAMRKIARDVLISCGFRG